MATEVAVAAVVVVADVGVVIFVLVCSCCS